MRGNRRDVGGKLEFMGLNLSLDKYSASAEYALVADNVFVDSGRPRMRLGRRELSEDQLDPQRPLGLASFATPSGEESVVIVRVDGIFQRKG